MSPRRDISASTRPGPSSRASDPEALNRRVASIDTAQQRRFDLLDATLANLLDPYARYRPGRHHGFIRTHVGHQRQASQSQYESYLAPIEYLWHSLGERPSGFCRCINLQATLCVIVRVARMFHRRCYVTPRPSHVAQPASLAACCLTSRWCAPAGT